MWGAVGALLQFRGPLAYLRAENVGIAMKTAGAWRSAKTGNWPNIILSSTDNGAQAAVNRTAGLELGHLRSCGECRRWPEAKGHHCSGMKGRQICCCTLSIISYSTLHDSMRVQYIFSKVLPIGQLVQDWINIVVTALYI